MEVAEYVGKHWESQHLEGGPRWETYRWGIGRRRRRRERKEKSRKGKRRRRGEVGGGRKDTA